MKANLKIKDIGGLKGEHSFALESGKLNVIEASNSGGKTSVVRALTSVLSLPTDGDLDQYTLDEAQKLGIKADEKNPQEGFVNVHADVGEVLLEIEGSSELYKVRRNGDTLTLPKNGDQRFLLAGILSNDTKILRQLHGVENNEPDDFKWAVNQLSYAQNYESINNILKNKKEDLTEKKYQIDKTIDKLETLQKQKKELEKKIPELDKELEKLKPRFKGDVDKLFKKRERLVKEIDNLNIEIGIKKGQLDGFKSEWDAKNKNLSNLNKDIDKIKDEIDSLKIDELKKKKEVRVPEIEKEVFILQESRSTLDAQLNLFVTAQASLRKHEQETKCPLCNDGHITYKRISEKLDELRHEKDKISSKIAELNQEKNGLNQGLESLKNKHETLNKNLNIYRDKLDHAKKDLKEEVEKKINSNIDKIKDNEKNIASKKSELEEIKQIINKSDEEINKLYTQREKERNDLSIQLGVIHQQIQQSSIEIGGLLLEPVKAKKVCDEWITTLEDVLQYSSQKAEEQRQKAAKRFNENIEELLKKLGFKEFRNVKLNKDYRLYVERLNPKTKEYVVQNVQTLSTSEKLTVALILQAALKETYIPDIPFFIIDDIMEDFDEERKTKVMDYLIDKANTEGWFVVVTKVVENAGIAKVRYVGA